jgi:hypothetical protein
MASSSDPLDWVRQVGVDVPWEYDVFEAFARVYLDACEARWAKLERLLPGIGREVVLLHLLRSGSRRN